MAELAAAHPGERIYAAAFHLFYVDDIQILPPALAVNSEAAVHESYGCSTRFVPPEWRWDVLDGVTEVMAPWYPRLSEEYLADASDKDAAMAALESAHDSAMARVCIAMTATARRGGIHGSPEFVVVILDGQRGDEEAALIRRSVDPRVLRTLPDLVGNLEQLEGA
ncbi:hypothetical protein [Spirillospora sp. CA-294931]|uniref:hypothetical protein n=1 Tax=Spirillospora sp. CA-294931 TaxID=3240042 RepID=UPI003D9196EC